MLKPDWWCELHQKALDKIGSQWIGLREFTEYPWNSCTARDLLHLRLIECASVHANKHQPKNTIALYRRK